MLKHQSTYRQGENILPGESSPTGKFGRMFATLSPFLPKAEDLVRLAETMKDVSRGFDDPVGDNPQVTAGYTYLGQFIAHDISFDATTLQETIVDPSALINYRTPRLDLDSVYGGGPLTQPYLYQRQDRDLFLIGETNEKEDHNLPGKMPFELPRAPNGFAIVGDLRNDENLITSQLHLAFLKFHNKIVEGLRNKTIPHDPIPGNSVFEEARELVTWHYQWIILNDFLPRILDKEQFQSAKEKRRFYKPARTPFIPVEFSAAAYRFGHSMIRPAYNYNRLFPYPINGVQPSNTVLARLDLLFRFSGSSGPGNTVPIPSRWIIDWRRFFELSGDMAPVPSRQINPSIAELLHHLPMPEPPRSLVIRNLLRQRSFALPSGQNVAMFMSFEPLSRAEISQGPDGKVAAELGFHIESPLWYYILKEAEIQGRGNRLGQAGSRIVAEVILGLLENDNNSFLVKHPRWKPVLPAKEPGSFKMTDLLSYVGNLNPICD